MAEAVRAIVPTPREAWDEHAWATYLAAELRVPVGVVFTRSRKMPVAMRPLREPRGALEVRLHAQFSEAPLEVRAALASWLRSGPRAPRATGRLDAYIAELLRRTPPPAARRIALSPSDHHDLEQIAQELCASELASDFRPGSVRPAIGWGRRGRSRTRNSLRLGSYDSDSRLVRIHPVLDQPAVPGWFVRFVVFHELLHAVYPVERGADQRWIHHGPAFRRRERAYVDHDRARLWERAHLARLIRSARTGEPLAAAREDRDVSPPRVRADAVVTSPPLEVPRRPGVLRALQQLLFPES